MGPWTERAEELGDAMCELGSAAGCLFASAWRARVDLEAIAALAGAAHALRQRLKLRLRGEVLPSDRELRERAEDLEADAGDLLRAGRQMQKDAQNAWSAACDQLKAARAAMNAAKTSDTRAEAQADANEAQARIADCEVALEILADVTSRTAYAIWCLQRVPDDLATTYEAAYSLKRRGLDLPADGDFLTGTPEPPAARATPAPSTRGHRPVTRRNPDPDPGAGKPGRIAWMGREMDRQRRRRQEEDAARPVRRHRRLRKAGLRP